MSVLALAGPAKGLTAGAFGLLIAGTAALAAGVLDDARGASPRLRLAIEALGAAAAVALGYRLSVSGVPSLDAAVSVVLLVGFANSFNLVDGIDGLAGGLGAVAAVFLATLGAIAGDRMTVLAGAALAGCCTGFLRHNLSEKKVFLGDGGSLFLGMTLSALAIRLGATYGGTAADAAAPLLVLAVPALDTAFAIVRRVVLRKPIFAGDRGHIYDCVIRKGLDRRTTLLLFLAAGCLSGTVAVGWWSGRSYATVAGLGTAASITLAWHINRLKPHPAGQPRRGE